MPFRLPHVTFSLRDRDSSCARLLIIVISSSPFPSNVQICSFSKKTFDLLFFELANSGKAIYGISSEAAHTFCDNQIYFASQGIGNHFFEAFALFCVQSCYALVRGSVIREKTQWQKISANLLSQFAPLYFVCGFVIRVYRNRFACFLRHFANVVVNDFYFLPLFICPMGKAPLVDQHRFTDHNPLNELTYNFPGRKFCYGYNN